MKKIIMIALLTIISCTVSRAAEYHEEDLYGTWELVSFEGAYPGFSSYMDSGDNTEGFPSSMKYMYLGIIFDKPYTYPNKLYNLNEEQTYKVINSTDGGRGVFYYLDGEPTAVAKDYPEIGDFFITGNNMLHIYVGVNRLIPILFKIDSLTDKQLILRGLDDLCKVVYKRVGTSNVNAISQNEDNNAQYYNINGLKTDKDADGVLIEKKGRQSKKVISVRR